MHTYSFSRKLLLYTRRETSLKLRPRCVNPVGGKSLKLNYRTRLTRFTYAVTCERRKTKRRIPFERIFYGNRTRTTGNRIGGKLAGKRNSQRSM